MLNMHFQQMGIKQILTKGIVSSELLTALRAAHAPASFHDKQEP